MTTHIFLDCGGHLKGEKREESGELIRKEWLPPSLDLHPTEKVWDLLYLSKERTKIVGSMLRGMSSST